MKYAIIRLGGHQHKVTLGEEILVDKLPQKATAELLLVVEDDSSVKLGQPVISGSKVEFSVLGEEKGEKIDVFKYKSKARSRKKIGFRAHYTRVRIDKVVVNSK